MRLLIIGKKSFLGESIHESLKKKIKTTLLDFEKLKKKKISFFKKFNYIVNCSTKKEYIERKYKNKYDIDLFLAKKIKSINCRYIMLSTRKVYKARYNIKENFQTNPKENYAKNKLITEKKLFNILSNKLLILRISNILGIKKKGRRRIHTTFLDYFINNISNNQMYKFNNNVYKDFLSINQFTNIFYHLLKKTPCGIINISIGKKIYLQKLINWLNFYNNNKKFSLIRLEKRMNHDSFTLNNDRLKKIIPMKILISELRKDCKMISKKLFL